MAQYNRVILSGTLPQSEVWSVSMNFSRVGDQTSGYIDDYDDMLAWAAQIETAYGLAVNSGAIRSIQSSNVVMNKVRIEARNAGVLVQAAERLLSPAVAGTGTQTCPNQTALVVSNLTGRPGRSFRGRTYWPALAPSLVSNTSGISTGVASNIATNQANLLVAIANAAGEDNFFPVIYSTVNDAVTRVTSVQVGITLDTQRRRRDAIVETRVTATLPS